MTSRCACRAWAARRCASSSKARETSMPLAHIHILEGRTEDQKRAVIEKVTAALVEALDAPQQSVRVLIQEVPKTNWGIAGQSAKDLGR
ncbi:2-hydroxymuconate tautomerase [Nitrogeniibacter aestuarii]|uniref:2-hydroxymuconate tautomerase n=2 Tax=Nitrogeniibacter aestuarii TaxID=2815343 RepID=UPI001D11EE23|nr:2-hydroxymuconate tautomerase [Nitrogeniibacter aestuarii]